VGSNDVTKSGLKLKQVLGYAGDSGLRVGVGKRRKIGHGRDGLGNLSSSIGKVASSIDASSDDSFSMIL